MKCRSCSTGLQYSPDPYRASVSRECDPELSIPLGSALKLDLIFAELPERGDEGFHIGEE